MCCLFCVCLFFVACWFAFSSCIVVCFFFFGYFLGSFAFFWHQFLLGGEVGRLEVPFMNSGCFKWTSASETAFPPD